MPVEKRQGVVVSAIVFVLTLVMLFLMSDESHAKLPDYPTFTLTAAVPPAGSELTPISKFVLFCAPSGTTTFTQKWELPYSTPPIVFDLAVGTLPNGSWTCYADSVFITSPIVWKPSNRVTFTVNHQAPLVVLPASISVQ